MSGIEDIIIVTGKGKRAIEDHFDKAPELEKNLAEKHKYELLQKVNYASDLADIHYIRQKEPKGLGHAVWSARKFIGDDPFAVLLGDDIVQSNIPCLQQLINQYEKLHGSIIGVQNVPEEETHRYGIVKPDGQEQRLYKVADFVEKPVQGTAPSTLAIMGRYILTPEIFDYLDEQEIGAGGEIQLTDAIKKLNQVQKVFAYDFEGKRFDVGEKLGYVKTIIEMALQREEMHTEVLQFMKDMIEKDTGIVKNAK